MPTKKKGSTATSKKKTAAKKPAAKKKAVAKKPAAKKKAVKKPVAKKKTVAKKKPAAKKKAVKKTTAKKKPAAKKTKTTNAVKPTAIKKEVAAIRKEVAAAVAEAPLVSVTEERIERPNRKTEVHRRIVFVGTCSNCDHVPVRVNKLLALLSVIIFALSAIVILEGAGLGLPSIEFAGDIAPIEITFPRLN